MTESAVARDPGTVRVRPRRIRTVCWILAPALVVMFALLSIGLHGSTGSGAATFQRGDQLAMAGLGVLGGFVVLLFTRPRVEADAQGVRVRNVFRGYDLPWDVVRAVRFDRSSAWASLELHDDELVPVLALQAVDRELAVDGVRALRALHAAQQQPQPAQPAQLEPEVVQGQRTAR
ncbi:PH domain-containing protein [Plantactinospora sp. CA-294935]|uniref:PH domain-containing protein n=1 Tax=Plantactinospora sp. CA-294935 TaxID=3240012 RepID=UPI003D934B1C